MGVGTMESPSGIFRVVIVYHIVGVGIKVFEIATTAAECEKIMKCNGYYLNSADWVPECEWLVEFLDIYAPVLDEQDEIFPAHIPAGTIHAVVLTGYVP